MRWSLDTLYPQKLALTSPISGGRSVGIVRLRTKGHGGFSFILHGIRISLLIPICLHFVWHQKANVGCVGCKRLASRTQPLARLSVESPSNCLWRSIILVSFAQIFFPLYLGRRIVATSGFRRIPYVFVSPPFVWSSVFLPSDTDTFLHREKNT
jgi:hypothetical protein